WAQTASAAFACTSGPYWARPVAFAGATPSVTAPHRAHSFACTWYSITVGGDGGDASNTCRFCIPVTVASPRSAPQQPHAAGPHSTVSSGSGDCLSVEDRAPGCLPGRRPDRLRSDRSLVFFWYGLSEEGGLEDVEESLPRRRSSSSTRAASTASCARAAASCAAASPIPRPRSSATSAGGGMGGISGTSHHDQHIRIAIKPTRYGRPAEDQPIPARRPPPAHSG